MKTRKVYYRRFQKTKQFHFCPAPGYNCPRIPLGSVNIKGPDYEIVKVIKTEGDCKYLRGRRVLISWGLNLPTEKQAKVKQVLAVDENSRSSYAEIILAVA